MTRRWPAEDPRWRRLDRVFVLLAGAMFGWNLLAWRGVVGGGTAGRPLSLVLLTGGLFVLTGASVLRRRSALLQYLALMAAGGLLVVSALVDR